MLDGCYGGDGSILVGVLDQDIVLDTPPDGDEDISCCACDL